VFLLNTLGNVGQFEGGRIKTRTHGPLYRNWVLEGRGYPGTMEVRINWVEVLGWLCRTRGV
jgi:hypothetical protein